MAETINVLIVDDHLAVAESLQALLSRQSDLDVGEVATNGNAAMRIAAERTPQRQSGSVMSRVLVVDDDPYLGRSVERVLEREGFVCHIASDSTSAAEAAAEFKPDVILIELQPEHAPTLPQLRAALGAVPFVFMAGHQEDYAGLGDLVSPSDDWLAKPAAPRELVVRLRTVLRRAQPN